MKVHQIRIDFNVTEAIKRFVYVYIIESESCYMIDSGVFGCEKQIISYLTSIGRDISEIKAVFLTHAHPDHIGSAAWFRENTGCKIYAGNGEKVWIENIDLQFKERPIPNFYNLAGRSVKVDVAVNDGDEFDLEQGLTIKAVSTPGHSIDGMSYQMGNSLFIGDAVPVKGDIPIFINEKMTRDTLNKLKNLKEVDVFFPAWDKTYDHELMQKKLADAVALIDTLKAAVNSFDPSDDDKGLVKAVCDRMNMPMLADNPLFAKTTECLRNKGCFFLVDTYIDKDLGRGNYDRYIEKVRPIVEKFGGEYILRSENLSSLSSLRDPQRVIVIRFPNRMVLEECFSSFEYKAISQDRAGSVDARAVIAE